MSAAQITDLHRIFCTLTRAELRLGLGEYSRERAWVEFVRAGFTAEDLRTVIHYLQVQIKAGERRPGCLRFRNLIERLEDFEEELSLAKIELKRKRPPLTANEKIIAQRERPVNDHVQHTAKPISDYIAKLRKAAE